MVAPPQAPDNERMRLFCWFLAVAGAAALVVTAVIDLGWGDPGHAVWVLVGPGPFYLVGLLAWLRRPDHPVVRWLLAVGTGFAVSVCLSDSTVPRIAGDAAATPVLMVSHWAGSMTVVASVGLLGLFPSGRVERGLERWMLLLVGGVAAVLPILVVTTAPTVVEGVYPEPGTPEVVSQFFVEGLAPLGPAVRWLLTSFPLCVIAGLGLLASRYRRSPPPRRRQIRWLLAGGLVAFTTGWGQAYVLLALGRESVVTQVAQVVLWPITPASFLGSMLVALFHEGMFGIDRLARRRVVYRVLQALIVAGYVSAIAALGVVLARLLPIGAALLVAVAAAVGLQPVWRWCERQADRWVFGARLDGYTLLARFGASLERSPGPARLLQELADTVQRGLDLTWARVRLGPTVAATGPDDRAEALLTVPISHDGIELGGIECGPRRDGNPLLEEDRRLLGYLAGQAAAAAHNLYLTGELVERLRQIERQAAELASSRERVAAVQDAERRRIQRDLHDGVQQEVVAVTATLELARQQLRRGDPRGEQTLSTLQDDLGTLLGGLRDVAYTIHPPVLTDRGLLAAVEAQAARLPLAMAVRADPVLRDARYAPQIEATAWYVLAEALSNVVKHAGASRVDVSLRQSGGRLLLTVSDDGGGFDPGRPRGLGLTGLADRLDIIGGDLRLDSTAGAGTTLRIEIPLTRQEKPDG